MNFSIISVVVVFFVPHMCANTRSRSIFTGSSVTYRTFFQVFFYHLVFNTCDFICDICLFCQLILFGSLYPLIAIHS